MVHDLGQKKEKRKRKKGHPTYPVQYLRNKTTARILDLGPTVRLVETMALNSMQKEREKTVYKEKNRSTC